MQRTYFFATGLRSISANKTGLSAHANESCQSWRLRIGRLPSQLLIPFFKPMLMQAVPPAAEIGRPNAARTFFGGPEGQYP